MNQHARLLIVDDEKNMLVMLKKVLSRNGMEIDVASSGEEALQLVEKSKYDLALIDICMKPMDGLELLEAIRKAAPNTGAIMLTGYPSPYSIQRSEELGAIGYLTKPIGIIDLNKAIDKALGGIIV